MGKKHRIGPFEGAATSVRELGRITDHPSWAGREHHGSWRLGEGVKQNYLGSLSTMGWQKCTHPFAGIAYTRGCGHFCRGTVGTANRSRGDMSLTQERVTILWEQEIDMSNGNFLVYFESFPFLQIPQENVWTVYGAAWLIWGTKITVTKNEIVPRKKLSVSTVGINRHVNQPQIFRCTTHCLPRSIPRPVMFSCWIDIKFAG